MTDEQKVAYEQKSTQWPVELKLDVERAISLRVIDTMWIEHLKTMESLRESIGLRGYAQREPIVEYKREAYDHFQQLQAGIDAQITDLLLRAQIEINQPVKVETPTAKIMTNDPSGNDDNVGRPTTAKAKVGRNDPCPCGATLPDGRPKKYKHCHGKNA